MTTIQFEMSILKIKMHLLFTLVTVQPKNKTINKSSKINRLLVDCTCYITTKKKTKRTCGTCPII